MISAAHLWAVGYDDINGASQARELLSDLAWNTGHVAEYLVLEDVAVVVRHADGTFTVDRAPLSGIANISALTAVGFLAGAVVAAPLAGAAIGALVGSVGTAIAAAAKRISPDFIQEIEDLMKPGTSALFVLDHQGDMEVILHTLRGQGGTVLKTNVSPELTQLIQSTLASKSTAPPDNTATKNI
jgi:uncharacterized membrane protein